MPPGADGARPAVDGSKQNPQDRFRRLLPRAEAACRDPGESRFLQGFVGKADDSQKEQIFDAVLPHMVSLCSDHFGHNAVMALLENASMEQRKVAVDTLRGDVFSLATNKHGFRVVQKLLELLPVDEQAYFLTNLETNITECINDLHGNNVVQAMIKVMEPFSLHFVVSAVENSAVEMAKHAYANRIFLKLLERAEAFSDAIDGILVGLADNAQDLSTDRYGNYVIQTVLDLGSVDAKSRIIQVVGNSLVEMSTGKCSQHVVEKSIEAATVGKDHEQLPDECAALYRAVSENAGDADSVLRKLAFDKFGNFVVQSFVTHAKGAGAEGEELKEILKGMEAELKSNVNGKHIVTCMKKVSEGAA